MVKGERQELELFFELIRLALGNQERLSRRPSEAEWNELFALSQKQALIGVCFSGLERLPEEQRPTEDQSLEWFYFMQQVERQNRLMDQRTDEATAFFRSHGFKTLILKGQGIAQLYPFPKRRQSGDIDIWLDGGRKRIYDFARKFDKEGKLYGVNYHHIHFHLFEDAEIEAHIYPCCLNNPFLNRKLHRFFETCPPSDTEMTPTPAFNRVFILVHCFNHLTGHGVGLRQVMDYYFVLKQGFSEEEKQETLEWLKKLRLMTFAGAMMWLQKTVFGLEDKYLLVAPNEKEGRFFLEEICQTGNMGHYDERDWGSTKTPFSRFLFNLRRDAHFVLHYPQEVLWQPFFNLWLYFWRLLKGLNE